MNRRDVFKTVFGSIFLPLRHPKKKPETVTVIYTGLAEEETEYYCNHCHKGYVFSLGFSSTCPYCDLILTRRKLRRIT